MCIDFPKWDHPKPFNFDHSIQHFAIGQAVRVRYITDELITCEVKRVKETSSGWVYELSVNGDCRWFFGNAIERIPVIPHIPLAVRETIVEALGYRINDYTFMTASMIGKEYYRAWESRLLDAKAALAFVEATFK